MKWLKNIIKQAWKEAVHEEFNEQDIQIERLQMQCQLLRENNEHLRKENELLKMLSPQAGAIK